MSKSIRVASVWVMLSFAGCGDASSVSATREAIAEPPPAGSLTLDDLTIDEWQSALPPNTIESETVLGDTVVVRGCSYTIGTSMQMPPYPPVYPAFVRRSGNDDHCAVAYVVLGASYGRPSVAMIAGQGTIVADYSERQTPSGEAHTRLQILELSPSSGQILRRAVLAAMSPSWQWPQLGNVYDGALHLAAGGTLVVSGNKNGIIPGELGSGDHYVAIYQAFLRAESPTPTAVTAF